MWITNGPEANVMVIYARTADGAKQAHTAFIVDGAKVFKREDKERKMCKMFVWMKRLVVGRSWTS
jgi:alkylation response protein AidB-like acyl-CoA dehydrogenase